MSPPQDNIFSKFWRAVNTMVFKPGHKAAIAQGIIAGGLAAIGIATGTGPLATLATTAAGVGVNVASDLATRSFHHWCGGWFTERGALNHDVSWALSKAFSTAVAQLECDWQKSEYYQRLKITNPSAAQLTLDGLRALQADARLLFSQPAALADGLEQPEVSALLAMDSTKARTFLSDALHNALYGHDAELATFLERRLADEWLFRFEEVLKDDSPEATRAWKACQRLWQTSLESAIVQMRQDVTDTLADVRWLKNWAQRLEQLPLPNVANKQPSTDVTTIPFSSDTTDAYPVGPAREPYFAQPYGLLEHFVGREEETAFLSNWLKSSIPTIVVHAIGGMGKSALVAQWLEHEAIGDKSLEGIIWWSFNEEPSFDEFCRKALAYVSSVEPEEIVLRKDNAEKLYQVLAQKRFLVILDGFERQLSAYTGGRDSSDAVPNSSDKLTEADPETVMVPQEVRRCIDPSVGRFLRWTCAAGVKSRFIVTSRLVPYELENELGRLEGCVLYPLDAFSPREALQLFATYGIRGTRAEICELCELLGYHPLSVRLLVGLLVADPFIAKDVAVAKTYMSEVLSHPQGPHEAVASVFRHLPQPQKVLLSWCAAFGSTITISDMLRMRSMINRTEENSGDTSLYVSRIKQACVPVDPNSLFHFDSDVTQRTGSRVSPEQGTHRLAQFDETIGSLSRPQTVPTQGVGVDRDLREQVLSLINRGLLQQAGSSFTLHPIIRSYAHKQLSRANLVHLELADYYAKAPLHRNANSLDELYGAMELFRHLVAAEQYDLAFSYLVLNLVRPLYFRFGNYYLLSEMLETLFVNGSASTPQLSNKAAQAHALSLYSRLLSKTGQSRRAISSRIAQMHIREGQNDQINLAVGLGYLSQDQFLMGDLAGALTSLKKSLQILANMTSESHSTSDRAFVEVHRALHLTFLGHLLSHIGQYIKAGETNSQAMTMWERLDHHRVGISSTYVNEAQRSLFQGQVENALSRANLAQVEAEVEHYERATVLSKWLTGAALHAKQDHRASRMNLEEALRRCRSIHLVEYEADILIDLAKCQLAQDQTTSAYESAWEALVIAERCEYRLKRADANYFLAHWSVSANDREAAKQYCRSALIDSFGLDWEAFVDDTTWNNGWWDACVSDAGSAQDRTGVEHRNHWRCGYKPTMDAALVLWHLLS